MTSKQPLNLGVRFDPYKCFISSLVPEWLEERPDVLPLTKLVYARLARHAAQNGRCFPRILTLAKSLGVSERTARHHLAVLRELGLIEARSRGFARSNDYYFLVHPWNIDRFKDAPRGSASVTSETDVRLPSDVPLRHREDDIRESDLRDSLEENQSKKKDAQGSTGELVSLLRPYEMYISSEKSDEISYGHAIGSLRSGLISLVGRSPISGGEVGRHFDIARKALRDRVPVDELRGFLLGEGVEDRW